MCGRFVQAVNKKKLSDRFDVAVPEAAQWKERYNLAPGQPAAVIVAGPSGPQLDFCVWGLIPPWSKDQRIAFKMINARVETLWEKSSFRDPLRYRRCLVPANGFYEWTKSGPRGARRPWYFTVAEPPLFAFAGLWAIWNDGEGGSVHSFTVITCPAGPFMAKYHHRMPLILPPSLEAAWLDHRLYRPEELQPLLESGSDTAWQAHAVSAKVNSPRYDSPDCIAPADDPGPSAYTPELF